MNLDLKEIITDIISREYPSAQIKDMHYITLNTTSELSAPNSNVFYFGFLSSFSALRAQDGDTAQEIGVQFVQFLNGFATMNMTYISQSITSTTNSQIIVSNMLTCFNYIDITSAPQSNLIFTGIIVELSDLIPI